MVEGCPASSVPEVTEWEVRDMSAVSMRGMRGWRRLALPVAVVAVVAGTALVAGAATGDEDARSERPDLDSRGPVTDAGVNPWGANDPALLAGIDLTAAVASSRGGREITWNQTGTGAVITREDGSMFAVATIDNSGDGPGAVVAKITLNGSSGTQKALRYTANGVFAGDEKFTLDPPRTDGTIPFTGSGVCVKGGTRVHKHERCSYTVSGTLDPVTNIVSFEIAGTSTR